MTIINYNVGDKSFTINGKSYLKIYQPIAVGIESISIYNIYDSRFQILGATPYDEITVNGSVLASQEDLIDALMIGIYDIRTINLGYKSFTTLALLQAFETPDINDGYKVTNDPTPSNNGYYHWVSGTTYTKDAELVSGVIESGNVDAVTGDKINTAISPFQKNATVPTVLMDAISNIEIYGADKNKEYSLTVFHKQLDTTGAWLIRIYEVTGGTFGSIVSDWAKTNYIPTSDIETILVPDINSSGISANITIDWSLVPDNTNLSAQKYDKTGIPLKAYVESGDITIDEERLISGKKIYPISESVKVNTKNIDTVYKGNETSGVEKLILSVPSKLRWINYASQYSHRNKGVNLIMVEDNISLSAIKIPLITFQTPSRLPITNDMVVRVAVNGVWVYQSTLLFADLVAWGINTQTSTNPNDYMYPVLDLPLITLNTGDELFVAWGCVEPSDRISMLYYNDGTGEGATYYDNNQKLVSFNDLSALVDVPVLSDSTDFTFAVDIIYIDYMLKKITDVTNGISTLETLPLVQAPKKVYTVFNDQINNQFDRRTHSVPLYFDGLVNEIVGELDINFKESGNEKIQIFSPELGTETLSEVKSYDFGDSKKYSDGTISFIQKSVKESVGKTITPRVICMGDSVTAGVYADVAVLDGMPSEYWGVIKEQFEKAKIDAGDNASEHNYISIGTTSVNEWNMTYKGVSRTLKSYSEGHGGWHSGSDLYWSMNWDRTINNQGLWDLLGLGDGTGTDYVDSVETLKTTPEGKFAPVDTPAFLTFIQVNLDATVTNYTEAVNALNLLQSNPVNPFYDKTTAQTSNTAFSVTKYIERYKTLSDDGTTRLTVGSTAGTEVVDANAYDVCVPTHWILQHSHNDGDITWIGENYRKWTDKIKADYVANGWAEPFIGISIIRHTGTYYPSRYPMFDRDSIRLELSPKQGFFNYTRVINEFWVNDANEDTEKVFIIPSLNVQPTAWATPFRKVQSPEYDITGLAQHDFMVLVDSGGGRWHPNAICHRVWGNEMYAWIKYTLSL